jgi:outer membrane biosynthesis protein TonB
MPGDADSLAQAAAELVRGAIDEAERRAREIVAAAEEQADRIREQAEREAREGLDEVRAALERLQGHLTGRGASEIQPGPVIVPEPEPPTPSEPGPEPVPEPMPPPIPEPRPDPVPEPSPPPDEGTPPSARLGDESGARLVAMKLALDGASREEARRKLAAEYGAVADLDRLLDDVYAKVAG